eukprot:gene7363-biopygen4498
MLQLRSVRSKDPENARSAPTLLPFCRAALPFRSASVSVTLFRLEFSQRCQRPHHHRQLLLDAVVPACPRRGRHQLRLQHKRRRAHWLSPDCGYDPPRSVRHPHPFPVRPPLLLSLLLPRRILGRYQLLMSIFRCCRGPHHLVELL